MNIKSEKEEYLEKLWTMMEDKEDSLQILSANMNRNDHEKIIQELQMDDLVQTEGNSIKLSSTGEKKARKIIRAHRLAEKLIFDALGGDYEKGACEFEHMVNTELIDSICILLGHPQECPHGRKIPQGDCCKNAVKTVECAVMPMTDMEIDQSFRVAYINGQKDNVRLNKISTLQIRPGSLVKMEQKYPSIVIQCEGADIALDDNIAADIYVWKEANNIRESGGEQSKHDKKSRFEFMRINRGR